MQPNLPILYSFRRCPYAMRARLALAVSRQTCVLREVDLRNRPPELHEASAKGTVPVLVLWNGDVIDESLDVMRWTLHRHDPEHWLETSEEQKLEVASLIERCDGEFKHHLDRYKYAGRQPGEAPEVHREQASLFLRQLDLRLVESPFLFGPKACIADMALAPFVRQFAFADREWFDGEPWNALRKWLDDFIASPLFASIMSKHDVWHSESAPLVVDWL